MSESNANWVTSVVTVSPKDIMTHSEGYFSDQVKRQLVDQITDILTKDLKIQRSVDWATYGVSYKAEVITMDIEKYKKLRRILETNNINVQDENGDIVPILEFLL